MVRLFCSLNIEIQSDQHFKPKNSKLSSYWMSFITIRYRIPPPPLATSSSYGHCIAIIDSDRLFATGIHSLSSPLSEPSKTWLYSKSEKNWSQTEPLPTKRSYMGCGVIRDSLQSNYIRAKVISLGLVHLSRNDWLQQVCWSVISWWTDLGVG